MFRRYMVFERISEAFQGLFSVQELVEIGILHAPKAGVITGFG